MWLALESTIWLPLRTWELALREWGLQICDAVVHCAILECRSKQSSTRDWDSTSKLSKYLRTIALARLLAPNFERDFIREDPPSVGHEGGVPNTSSTRDEGVSWILATKGGEERWPKSMDDKAPSWAGVKGDKVSVASWGACSTPSWRVPWSEEGKL